ncbi:MAG: hypothetical protein PHE74_00075 [Comamonas sp.]|nr:hypothetical protein [Comamonas sp.]
MSVEDQQAENEAFEQGFAQASGQPIPASEATAADAGVDTATEGAQPDASVTTEAVDDQPDASNQPDGAQAPAGQGSSNDPEDDPVVLDGFKRSEVKRLLEQASKVPDLELQLRKAHGKIGDLGSKLQTPPVQQAAPVHTAAPELPPELVQFEQDFPEFAAYAKALFQAQQPAAQAAPPAQEGQTVATAAAPASAELDPVAIELAVMDRMHSGWREKVTGQEFGLWLAAQGQEVQSAFAAADTAQAMAAVIDQFDQWGAAKAAQAQKHVKGKQRLAAAVTPQGNAPQPQAALTEEQAFEMGFNTVMGRR